MSQCSLVRPQEIRHIHFTRIDSRPWRLEARHRAAVLSVARLDFGQARPQGAVG